MSFKEVIIGIFFVSILVLSGCASQQDLDLGFVCEDILSPDVALECRFKTGNVYEYCTLYITPQNGFEEGIEYSLFSSVAGTEKLDVVPAVFKKPFDDVDSLDNNGYNYYFRKMFPDEVGDMFILVPEIVGKNGDFCDNLMTNIMFTDAEVIE